MARRKTKPEPGTMSARLEFARSQTGLTLKEFHHRLLGPDDDDDDFPSYPSAQAYHRNRVATTLYLARVADVFGADLRWLAVGSGDPYPFVSKSFDSKILDEAREQHALEAVFLHSGARFLSRVSGTDRMYSFNFLHHILNDRGLGHRPDNDSDDWGARLELLKAFDELLADAWAIWTAILDKTHASHSQKPMRTQNQRERFLHGITLALYSALPDRGAPDSLTDYATVLVRELMAKENDDD